MIKLYWINRRTNQETQLPYRDGFVINEIYNEQLDNGTIVVPDVDELDIQQLDFIKLKENGTTLKTFCVGSISREWTSFVKPYKYDYTLNLASTTLLLQDKVLPNLTVTQPIEGKKKTILDEFQRIVEVFIPEYIISEELKALIGVIVCPEYQWNRKTVFEIFNDMLTTVGAVVKVDYPVISYLDLNLKDKEIDRKKITGIIEEKPIDEYCNEIEMSAENVISSQRNTFSMRNITPRSEDYVLTTENCSLILDRPIYRINKVEMCITNPLLVRYSVKVAGIVDPVNKEIMLQPRYYDITKYVIEESVYMLKKVWDKPARFVGSTNTQEYKKQFIYYTSGSNTIKGLTYDEPDAWFGWPTGEYALTTIMFQVITEYLRKNVNPSATIRADIWTDPDSGLALLPDPRNLLFNVDYKSEGDIRFRLNKTNSEGKNDKLIIDNQANSYVDADALIKAEQENVDRIGNAMLSINMAFRSLKEIPTYGSTFEGHILTQSQMSIFNERIYWTGTFTKDFIRKNMFTGIRSKARYTSIATGSEALTRKDLLKQEMIFTTEYVPNLETLAAFIIENINKNNNQFQIIIQTLGKNKYSSKHILMASSRFVLGKNIILGIKAQDNYAVNNQIINTSKTDAFTMKQVEYVDQDGEFTNLNIYFCKIPNEVTETNYNQWIDWSRSYPEITDERFNAISSKDQISVRVDKDNREIYAMDIQLQFKSEGVVIVYKDLMKYLPLLYQNDVGEIKEFYQTDNTTYTANDVELTGTFKKLEEIYTIGNAVQRPNEADAKGTFGLCDKNNNLLLVCNGDSSDAIYLVGGKQKLC